MEYEPISEELNNIAGTVDEQSYYDVFFWIFMNRILYGLDWRDRYE